MPTSGPLRCTMRPADASDKNFLWWLHRATMREYVDKTWGWNDDWQRQRFDEVLSRPRLKGLLGRSR
jgi:hypothetical protein